METLSEALANPRYKNFVWKTMVEMILEQSVELDLDAYVIDGYVYIQADGVAHQINSLRDFNEVVG